jgi:putative transcriptional regulator
MITPAPGILLIADPFLKDPNFSRTVVLMCNHQEEGSFGFVINKQFEYTLDELLSHFEGFPIPVYYGGPVQKDTVHFLHQYPNIIPGGQQIMDDVYWGGDFEVLTQMIKENTIDYNKIRFFIGYSGWDEGQLDTELQEKTWLTVEATKEIIFEEKTDQVWRESLALMGGDYKLLINFPIDPQLN